MMFARMAVVTLVSLGTATPVFAQSSPPRRDSDTPIFLFGVSGEYGSVQRGAAGAALFLPIEKWHCEDGLCGGRGIEVQGSVGAGGWRVAGGPVEMAFPLWFDVLLTVTGTSATPRNVSPHATYVGVEGGFAFPVGTFGTHRNIEHFINLRPTIGVAHRVEGPEEFKRTTLTWSVSVNLVWPKL